jgi:hypothetical protein
MSEAYGHTPVITHVIGKPVKMPDQPAVCAVTLRILTNDVQFLALSHAFTMPNNAFKRPAHPFKPANAGLLYPLDTLLVWRLYPSFRLFLCPNVYSHPPYVCYFRIRVRYGPRFYRPTAEAIKPNR